MWGMFLNTAKENMICSRFHWLFNNYLDFTISALLRHGSKNKILCTEPVFCLYCLLWQIHSIFLRNSVFVPIHVFWELVWLYLSAWISATLCFLSLAAVSQGQVFFSKTTLGKNLYHFISHWLRENGLSFKKTSLRVGRGGMTLGIYFNLSWALLFSSVKCWAWSRRNPRSLPTWNILGLH